MGTPEILSRFFGFCRRSRAAVAIIATLLSPSLASAQIVFDWSGGDILSGSYTSTPLLTTTIASGATLNLTTTADHDFNARAIVNNGTLNWTAGTFRGSTGATLVNNATLNDSSTGTFSSTGVGGATMTFTNSASGSYVKSAAGSKSVPVAFTNAGTITVTAGTLAFDAGLANTNGSLVLANASTLTSTTAINLGTGNLTGNGTVAAPTVTAGGLVSPGPSSGLLTITGNLTLLGTATTLFEIGGTTAGTQYDRINVSGTAALAGTLTLTFINGFAATVLPSDTFTLVSAAALTGTFANVTTNGLRLTTTDGLGSFQVNFTGTALTLSNFTPVPEPSTWALLLLGLGALMILARRRA